ncbi:MULTISPECIES: DNA polymerase IV [unclassified Diaminobutyricimonas]|uniref:DNA polymerase IV n=1 Tax=unclassified Diaminobutyricimonas TaxID=2643261 RepID=UPI0012F510A4|nr:MULTISPECIES: DNA polymerase IV [unclassified Diaminobutyricimonas]
MGKQDGSGRLVTEGPLDDRTATIMHVDLDAFFASVELLTRPELKGKPVIVGHRGARSVVTAATYEARRYGVNSAMPMSIALRKCPQAIVLEPHFERYTHYSKQVFGIIEQFTPLVEPLSIDEAFFDVSGARALFGGSYQIGTELRRRVHAETGLVCSVGAAATKYVAKLASGRSKPNGLLVIPASETIDFLHPQPITALWGVGGKTAEHLTRLGLRTIGDLATTPLDSLRAAIGEAGALRLHELSWGRDPRSVSTEREEKSVGHEVTFEYDVTDADVIRRELLRLSDQVGVRLRRHGVLARTVSLKLRFGDFTTITRSKTLGEPTDLGRRIYEEARALYEALGKQRARIRLVGVRAEQLVGDAGMPGLWDPDEDWREAEHTVDAVSERFGLGALRPASLVRRPADSSGSRHSSGDPSAKLSSSE